ncbi:MAG: HD domain-containing protein [Lachnospiraceae bacterium]|nr:HD domain-containing protein [Lachnospiraceae bacterium]
MKKSDAFNGRNKTRLQYFLIILFFFVLFGALFIYYINLRNNVFELKGVVNEYGNNGLRIIGNRSKEWREGGSTRFSRGMEYDFIVSNPTQSDIYDWSATVQFASDFDIDSSWNGKYEKTDLGFKIIPDKKSAKVESGEEQTFGLVMFADSDQAPKEYVLYYKIDAKMTDSPFFWVIVIVAGFTLSMFVSDEINSFKYRKIREKNEEIEGILQESFETFAHIIDAKDSYTEGHSIRVAEYSKLIAEEMGYSPDEQDRVYRIAMLHDIGKIGVTDLILKKPGRLDENEYDLIKTHVDIGGEILKDFKSLKGISEGAKYHHERWDGRGYSERLSGMQIPEIARIICVADSFDAMTSPRVYRKALPIEFARQEILRCAGRQFDPDIAVIMVLLIDQGKAPVKI